MSCPAPEQLAAAATEGDDAILAHALTCGACRHAIDDQRGLRALVQRTPAVALTRERRDAMAAELMAKADQLPAHQPALTHERRDAMAVELMAKADQVPTQQPMLTRERRESMAAERMAQADQLDASVDAKHRASHRRTVAFVVAGFAAAAAVVIIVATRGAGSRDVASELAPRAGSAIGDTRDVTAVEPHAPAATDPSRGDGPTDVASTDSAGADRPSRTREPRTTQPASAEPSVPPAPTRAKLAGTGDYARESGDARSSRDVVRLRGGELTVDSTGSRPVEIVSGGTAIAVTKARVKVISTRGVVSSVAVFAGSAEVTIDGHRVIVEAGTVWEPDVARDDALAAFKTGWAALRAGDHAAAIAAFDRASDPIVAEDASYWSAIASERADDTAGAVRRYRELLARFPATTRAAEARAAIERLAP